MTSLWGKFTDAASRTGAAFRVAETWEHLVTAMLAAERLAFSAHDRPGTQHRDGQRIKHRLRPVGRNRKIARDPVEDREEKTAKRDEFHEIEQTEA